MSSYSADDSEESFPQLNERQEVIFESTLEDFRRYLKSEGKNPRKEIGYSEQSIGTRVSRVLQAIEWVWRNDRISTEISPEQADEVIEALATDEFRRRDGDRYAEGSKRKISNALVNWFRFNGSDWEPDITFNDEPAKNAADPFTKAEVKLLWDTSLTYKSIPMYNNLTPDERDRWRRHLAQVIGKPKSEVKPADWDKVNKNWKYPSLIATERSAAWRPALINRMKVDWYDADGKKIIIPAEHAVKNDTEWTQYLSDQAAQALDSWLEQRSNSSNYDDTGHMWLTRKGNPYKSNTLNYLLDNLIEEAGINHQGRKLCWYSFRHSLGTYTYEEKTDLDIVAEVLRQNSTSSASRYVHPTKELQRSAADIL
ncbi:site-specific integrase [Haloarcula sp. S1CR25-12]|uniref:Site-specific integrase n=1 Tax=Haloarcula saliterrae TaxID=2950534 RepID=A0ABU2F8V4_9EURY|nr:site-specific integrase [Haloarcula sp. S1CR25-12]MDS0258679.1 site-specific integrase [Haloarcula sp. S1CR25-12]